jgi:hypothetical protein
MVQEYAALLRQRQMPRRAVHQLGAQPLFQRVDAPSHHHRRHLLLQRRRARLPLSTTSTNASICLSLSINPSP